MKTLIKNCRIVSPGVDIPEGQIVIEDKHIVYAGVSLADVPSDCNIIDANGAIAAPGFIDIHSHGRSNFDFCDCRSCDSLRPHPPVRRRRTSSRRPLRDRRLLF